MEKESQIEFEWLRIRPMRLPVIRVHLTRAQIFKLLQKEDLDELEKWQAPIYTQFINPNLP